MFIPRVFEPWLWSIQRLIGSYIRSWERPGDLPRVIEILCLSLGVRDSESCWFTKEIGTYMRCWEC
jgi:hypothetical protein